MSKFDIVRAWKDADYRNSLSAEEAAQLPENPAGVIELHDDELQEIAGGSGKPAYTAGCCGNTGGQWTCVPCIITTLLTLPLCVFTC